MILLNVLINRLMLRKSTLNATRFYSQSIAGADVEDSGLYNQTIHGERGVIDTSFSRQTIPPDYSDTEFISPDYGYASIAVEPCGDRHDIPTSGIPAATFGQAVSEVVIVVVIVVL